MNKLFSVCLFILVVEMCERLCYYSFAGSQRNFLQRLGSSNAQSTAINSVFSVITYITPIFGGWLADAVLGRYKTILFFAVIYCVGVVLAAVSAYPSIYNKGLYLFSIMALVTLGSGGIKPNIANFGGDQYDLSIPSEARQQETFFSYFYLVINIGAGVAYGYMVTLATNGAEPGIPEEYGFFASYMIAAGCMMCALIVFLAGSRLYVKRIPTGDSLRGLMYYIYHSARTTRRGKLSLMGWFLIVVFLILAIASAFVEDKKANSMAWTGLAVALVACLSLILAHIDNSHLDGIPDHPMDLLSRAEAKATLDVVPTLLVANVTFSIGYNAINGPYQSEACQMNLNVGGSQINGAFFNIADCIAIVIFVPILEKFILPFIERHRNGKKITGETRLICGMVTTVVSMITAIALEFARRDATVLVDDKDSNCAPAGVKMSDLSGFLMFIPFALIGVAEVFVNPFLYFFSYEQTPPRARSISQAFNLLSQGAISNGFTTAITFALVDYYTDDLNEGHLEYIYYVSGAAAIIGIPLTMFVQSYFIKKDYSEEVIGQDLHEKSEGVFVDSSVTDEAAEEKK